MPMRKGPRRPLFISLRLSPTLRRGAAGRGALLRGVIILAIAVTICVLLGRYIHEITMQMAMVDAVDSVTLTVNETVYDYMEEHGYGYNDFVTLERDNSGGVAAVTTNMARVNALAAELVSSLIVAAENGMLNLRIPLGNLLGSTILSGRGPRVPVKIVMLTSSHASFRNELITAGVNQTKHQILLEVTVCITVLLPWETMTTEVVTEVLVAETVIVGQVPNTYLNWEG